MLHLILAGLYLARSLMYSHNPLTIAIAVVFMIIAIRYASRRRHYRHYRRY